MIPAWRGVVAGLVAFLIGFAAGFDWSRVGEWKRRRDRARGVPEYIPPEVSA